MVQNPYRGATFAVTAITYCAIFMYKFFLLLIQSIIIFNSIPSEVTYRIGRRVAKNLLTGGHPSIPAELIVPTCIPLPCLPSNFFLTCCLKWYMMVNFLTVRTQFTIIYYVPRFFSDLTGGHSPLSLATPLHIGTL